MFPKYFQQEMSHLRELGADFAEAHPSLAPMLTGAQADPDVERLLEGTAFLTALLRQKLDDEFPEIVQDLMQIVAPHYLKPLPSSTILVFHPKSTVRQPMKVPAGITCASVPVDRRSCPFRTRYAMEVHPLSIVDAALLQTPGRLPAIQIDFELKGLPLAQWNPERVRLYLGDEFTQASDLYCLLRQQLHGLRLVPSQGGKPLWLESSCLQPVGFDAADRLVPSPSQAFPGFGVLQDYFVLPQKFLFLDIVGWDRWQTRGQGANFSVRLELNEVPQDAPRVSADSFVLNAAPAVNLFAHEADPILLDHRRTRYPIRPSGTGGDLHEVFSVDEVKGFVQGTCQERTYRPFDSFRRASSREPAYHVSYQASPVTGKIETFLAVAYPADKSLPLAETLSVKITCTDGALPGRLKAGDITVHGKGCPEYLTFSNALPPTPARPAPIGKNLLWRLLGHFSAGLQSLENAGVLQSMLDLYVPVEARDPAAMANRKRISAIESVHAVSNDRIVSGMVMRGREITVSVKPDQFAGRGDAYLFGTVLDTFLGNYASINSFTRLRLRDSSGGMETTWSPRTGNRPLI